MKLKFTLLFIATAICFQANAQPWVEDSVSLGNQYADDVFYNLSDGSENKHVADDWHIAFQMTKFGDASFNASVRANHIKGKVQVYSLGLKASTKFGSLTATDTTGKTNPKIQLVNNDTSWGEGAFTVARNTSSLVDFGWGKYDPPTHNLSGDSLYLVIVDGDAYQLWIQEYKSAKGKEQYKFRIAKYDGTGDVTDSIKRDAPYDNRLFAYYNIKTGKFIDREPANDKWDLQFRQYQKNRTFGSSPVLLQAYTGVLSNQDVLVTPVLGVDPSTITSSNYNTHVANLKKEVNTIGDDWKTFVFSQFSYRVHADTSYVVKAKTTNKYYLLQFTRFDGGSKGGKIVFRTKELGTYTTSINDVNDVQTHYNIFPNPATNQVTVMIDNQANAGTGVILVTDITGKVVMNTSLNIKKGLNAFKFDVSNYATGTYVVNIVKEGLNISSKVTVQH